MRMFLIFMLSLFILGCQIPQEIIVVTNEPSLLAYCDLYHSEQNQNILRIYYQKEPKNELDNSHPPDLIIGRDLLEAQILEKFDSLNDLFKNKKINSEEYYEELIQAGKLNNVLRAVPLSFTLPTIIYHQKNANLILSDMFYSYERLIDDSIELNDYAKGRYKTIGFAPIKNNDVFYYISELLKTNFVYSKTDFLSWNNQGLDNSLTYFFNWQEKLGFKFNQFHDQTIKYFNAPAYQLILDNTLGLYLYPSSILYKIPEEKLNNLDFRWLSRNEKIFIGDDIISAGIPFKAKNKAGAKAFIAWYLTFESQNKILKNGYQKRLADAGGFFNGFSALKNINEKILPKYNHLLKDKIPQEDFLQFPSSFSSKWSEFKKNKLVPWYITKLNEEKEDKITNDLLNFFKE